MKWKKDEIINLRISLGYTQHRLATLLGVSRRTVSRWETGRSSPGRKMREKLNQVSENVSSKNETSQNVSSNVLFENASDQNDTSQNINTNSDSWQDINYLSRPQFPQPSLVVCF